MPPLRLHQSNNFTKLLLIGNSGTGKTGALASLAEAGYYLRVLDFDNGLDILKNFLKASKAPLIGNIHPLDRVDFITVTDKFKSVGGKPTPVSADAFPRALDYLSNWTNKNQKVKGVDANGKPANIPIPADQVFDLGDPAEWGQDAILVIDSLTFFCNAALRYQLRMNGRPVGPIYESDWLQAQQLMESVLGMIYSESFATNVIVCAHIDERTDKETKKTTAFPVGLGKALGPKIGRFFNSMLEVRRTGAGTTLKRSIHTVPDGLLELKNPTPLGVLPKYDISTGLADFFKAVRG